MADDRSLADVIRFVDPSGDLSDADVASITKDLKFTEVLDLITYVGKDELDKAREILSKYDQRFTVAKEYSSVPTAAKSQSMFKPIQPKGSTSIPPMTRRSTSITPMSRGQGDLGDEEQDMDDFMNDPKNKNKPEVRQIQNLLQRMQKR